MGAFSSHTRIRLSGFLSSVCHTRWSRPPDHTVVKASLACRAQTPSPVFVFVFVLIWLLSRTYYKIEAKTILEEPLFIQQKKTRLL